MATKLIRLKDGSLIEVEVLSNQAQQISGGLAEKVETSLGMIKPFLIKVCEPIVAAWKEINQELQMEQAEIEIGLGFEAEGNLYVTKSTANANLKVKITLKPKP